MESLFYILANGGGDRVRGSISTLVGAFIFAFILSTQLNDIHILIPLLLAYWLGEVWGWGEPLGAVMRGENMEPHKLESWQKGILKTNAHLATLVRGFIWGLPISILLLLCGFTQLAAIVLVSYTISMWLSLIIVRYSPSKEKWGFSEFLRGCLVMIPIQYYFLTIHI